MIYFFDTNILFKYLFIWDYNNSNFNKIFKKSLNIPKFISYNVKLESYKVFIEYSRKIFYFLNSIYLELDKKNKTYKFTKSQKKEFYKKDLLKIVQKLDIINFKLDHIVNLIWNKINYDNKPYLRLNIFKNRLKSLIFRLNHDFYLKFNTLFSSLNIHKREEDYNDLAIELRSILHDSDLAICLDAHDLAISTGEKVIFFTADNDFMHNYNLILDKTAISDIFLYWWIKSVSLSFIFFLSWWYKNCILSISFLYLLDINILNE